MVRVYDNIHSCNGSHFKFLCFNARHTKLFPGSRGIGFFSGLNGLREFFKSDKAACDFRVIFNWDVKYFSSLVKFFIVAPVSYFLCVNWIGSLSKLFKVSYLVQAGVAVRQRIINLENDFGDLAKETEKEELSTEVPMRDCCDNCTLRLLNSPNKQNCTYIDLEILKKKNSN